jgi:hypothetical protein
MLISNQHGEFECSSDVFESAHDFVVLQQKMGKPTKFYWLVKKLVNYHHLSQTEGKVLAHHVLNAVPEFVD